MKLKVENSWENLTYYLNGKQLPLEGKVKLTNGEIVPFEDTKKFVTVSDMGHPYQTWQHIPVATINYSGANIKVNLTELDIEEIL